MNAKQILALQVISLVIMLFTIENLFTYKATTLIFAIAFLVFARCSIYINKNSKRLLKELSRKKTTYKWY